MSNVKQPTTEEPVFNGSTPYIIEASVIQRYADCTVEESHRILEEARFRSWLSKDKA